MLEPGVDYTLGNIAHIVMLITSPVVLFLGPDRLLLPPDLMKALAPYVMLPFERAWLPDPSPFLVQCFFLGLIVSAVVAPLVWFQMSRSVAVMRRSGTFEQRRAGTLVSVIIILGLIIPARIYLIHLLRVGIPHSRAGFLTVIEKLSPWMICFSTCIMLYILTVLAYLLRSTLSFGSGCVKRS